MSPDPADVAKKTPSNCYLILAMHGAPDPELTQRHVAACAVETAMIEATRPGATWAEAVEAGKAA